MNIDRYIITLEDDPISSRLIEKILNVKALHFQNPTELMSCAPRLNPLAAFIDIYLGEDHNGLEYISSLKSLWPSTPILVITSDGTKQTLVDAFASGATDFITKPLDSEELITRYSVRVEEHCKREATNTLTYGNVSLHYINRYIEGPKGRKTLTLAEANLLYTLFQTKHQILSKLMLKRRGWNGINISDSSLHRKMSEIRTILREIGASFELNTLYGEGYYL